MSKLQYWLLTLVKRAMTGRKQMDEQDAELKFGAIKHVMWITFHNLVKARKGTNCPKLWTDVFVDQYGNVFNCCYSRPGTIGNLYRTDMKTIWSSFRLRFFRWLSRHKALFCALECDLITEAEKNQPAGRIATDHPEVARVLHGELCNIACVMCWQNHRDRQTISNRVLQEQIDWSQVKEVELQGGEVLAMKEGKEFFTWLTETMNTKVSLITNGTLLNEVWAQKLVLGANWIQISVNAATKMVHEQVNRGSHFEKVTGNIRRLVQMKRELGTRVKIIYKFTIVPENIHEIADAILVAAELGCAKIAFGFDTATVPAHLSENPGTRTRLRDEIQQVVAANPPIEIEAIRLQRLGLL